MRRSVSSSFGCTDTFKVAAPCPSVLPPMVAHAASALTVHLHDALVAMVSLPLPPLRSKSAGCAVRLYSHACGGAFAAASCEIDTACDAIVNVAVRATAWSDCVTVKETSPLPV